ncbi:MAG: hypothetical protein WBE74_08150, partial [Terracidiphilus sp.]
GQTSADCCSVDYRSVSNNGTSDHSGSHSDAGSDAAGYCAEVSPRHFETQAAPESNSGVAARSWCETSLTTVCVRRPTRRG